MTDPNLFEKYTGFTETEVEILCRQYGMDFTEAGNWYDGYQFRKFKHVYNPKSVVEAMHRRVSSNYWTSTEAYDALKIYIDMNFDGLRADIVKMLGGDHVKVTTTGFQNDMHNFRTKDDVLTLLIHLGYLGYNAESKEAFIPNREIMEEFENAMSAGGWSEMMKVLKASEKLLEDTLRGDEKSVAVGLERAHTEVAPRRIKTNHTAVQSRSGDMIWRNRSYMNNREILHIALRQSACDCSCAPEDFLKQENVITESFPSEKARAYLKLPHICDLVSYGSNIVACGRKDLLPDIERYLSHVPNIESCFETPGIYPLNKILEKAEAEICFMANYFLPDMDRMVQFESNCGYELRVLGPEDFAELYIPQWKNALCKDRRHLDVIGVGAYDREKLIGLAGCSADCDTMWQIGVDVLLEYRRKGIASALTNKIARETLERGKVPFYCAAWSNVKSVKNAIRSGFVPGWVEITAKPVSFVEELMRSC